MFKDFYQQIKIINVSETVQYVNNNFEIIFDLLMKSDCYIQFQCCHLLFSDFMFFEREASRGGSYHKYFMCNKVLFEILLSMGLKTEWTEDKNEVNYKISYNKLMDNHILSEENKGWGLLLDLPCFSSCSPICFAKKDLSSNAVLTDVYDK